MTCYFPLTAYRGEKNPDTGKRKLVFSKQQAETGTKEQIPCGQCIGCKLERSLTWAIRCAHEAQMHEQNSFITLTYDPEHYPQYGSLDKTHVQKFFKRLRKQTGIKLRYYACGEYGEKLSRPHYHAIVFGYEPHDLEPISKRGETILYTSESLSKIWKKGFVTIGQVNLESAGYVARYCTKKITGDAAYEHYLNVDPMTGEILPQLEPEFALMSRRPGIGKDWFDKYHSDLFPSDTVHILKNNFMAQYKVPRFYDDKFMELNPEEMETIKALRKARAKERKKDNTPQRLEVREKVKTLQFNKLKRTIEQ